MATEDLYGHISLATREWKDGLLSTIMRDLGAIPNSAPKWIVLDGDLDANWIESMNSVMDDNRVIVTTHNSQPLTEAYFLPYRSLCENEPLYGCKRDPSVIRSPLSPNVRGAVWKG